MTRAMAVHPLPHHQSTSTTGILQLLQETCIKAELSHHELQRRSGVALTTIRRLRQGHGVAEMNTLEKLLSTLGVNLLVKRDDQWTTISLPITRPIHGLTASAQALRPNTKSLLDVIQVVAKAYGLCVNAIHRHTGISYSVVERIMNTNYMRVITPCESLLAALDLSLVAVTAAGDAIVIQGALPDPARGTLRQASYRAAVRRWRQSRPLAHPTSRRCQISKSEIFTLRHKRGMTCREIAHLAHISSERVRQILRTLNRAQAQPSRSGIDPNTNN